MIAASVTMLERLGLGALAILLCLVALIVWIFPIIVAGGVWKRMVRPRRVHWMSLVTWACFALTTAIFVGFPTTTAEIGDDLRIVHFYWITRWLEWRTTYGSDATDVTFSLVGVLALAPSIAILAWMARRLVRELSSMYRRPQSRCDECNYDLSGITSAVCPECGEVIH